MYKCALFLLTCCSLVAHAGEKEIVLGQSAAFSGSSSSLGIELWRGAQAYFNKVNEQGGVRRHKIRVQALDDTYDADATLTNTLKLVSDKSIFALFGYVGTPTLVRALPAMLPHAKDGLFLFSNYTGAQQQREAPFNNLVFNVRASYREETEAIVDSLVKGGARKIGMFVQSDAYGRSGVDGTERALQRRNMEVAAESTYQRGSLFGASYAEQVRILKSAGVDAVISVGSYEACAGFIRDARLAGWRVPIVNVSFVGANALLDLLLAEEAVRKVPLTINLFNSQVLPSWSDDSFPLTREYREAADALGDALPPAVTDKKHRYRRYSFSAMEGYLNAKLFVEILKRSKTPFTRENFLESAHRPEKLDVGLKMLIGFTPQDHQALHKVFLTHVRDGTWETVPAIQWEKP